MTEGILYIATAEEFLEQAKVSARTARESNEGINIGIITTESLEEKARNYGLFDDIITVDDEEIYDGVRDKSEFIDLAPYDKNLYLDGDTYVLGDLSPVFEGLERFEMMVAHEKYRPFTTIEDVPDSFPELNTGVMAFRSSERVMDFFKSWRDFTERQIERGRPGQEIKIPEIDSFEDFALGRTHPQPPFREALYKSDLDFSILPPEYNFIASGWVCGEVKILHQGRSREYRRLAENINKGGERFRTYIDSRGEIYDDEGRRIFAIRPAFTWIVEKIAANDTLKYLLRKAGLYRISKKIYEKLRKIHI